MEGKLIKFGLSEGYRLDDLNGNYIASTLNGKNKLSLKNCETVANGYDLDEYQEGVFYAGQFGHPSPEGFSDEQVGRLHGFIDGFQKALEILGDKKFSEEDILDAWEDGATNERPLTKSKKENLLQSLQQTEWDVEIEMICPHPEDAYVCGMQYGCGFDGDGCNHPNQIPYLDKDGCLILKRK